MKFLPSAVTSYLYKPTIHPCMESCCDIRNEHLEHLGYLNMWDKLQKRGYGTFGYTSNASTEPLAHRQNVSNLSLFYSY